MRYKRCRSWLVAGALAVNVDVTGHPAAQNDWTQPFPPFAITPNLHYVGSKGLASYLVTTPQGHVLINSNLEESVPLIRASFEKLGFKFSDIKILLISHAHWDHNAGSAAIKALTGAAYMVMDGDVVAVESGGKADFQYGNDPGTHYPATKVDRILHDGDEVKLGDVVLVAHLTPGHTKGCTTWTIKGQERGRPYSAVIIGSPNVNDGYRLVNNAEYPRIAADYERTFKVLKSLPGDIFLGAHGSYFDLEKKYARMQPGAGVSSPFVDPQGYQNYVADREQAFKSALAKQQGGRWPAGAPMTDQTKLEDFATRYAAAWSSQDAARLASFYSDTGTLRVNSSPPSVGRRAIATTAQGFMTAFPDMVVKKNSVSLQDGRVVFRWTWTGTNTGPGGTGKAVRIDGYEEWTMGADALITESKGHFDEAEYQRQLKSGR